MNCPSAVSNWFDIERQAATRRALLPTETVITFIQPDSADATNRMAEFDGLLDEGERRRAERFRFDHDRRLFITAHALTRLTLSHHANVDPREWRFSEGPHGRPEIASPASPMRFSLSHTKGLAACAVTLNNDVGFDVEDASRQHGEGVAERFFSAREAADLRGLPEAARRPRFFEYWTLKEAYIKARGMGLSLPLNGFSFYRDSDAVWRIEFAAACPDDPERWQFHSFKIGESHQCALAYNLRQFDQHES